MPEELKKSLGFWPVYALIITSMVGTSLFFGISQGARLAGSASIIGWIILGLITIYVGACFGELISMFPQSGGVYEFTKQAFGRFPSFLVGWIAWIVANIGSAVLVVAAIDFLLPGAGTISFGGYIVSRSAVKFVSAILIILLFNYVTYRGAQASGTLLLIFAFIMLGLLVLLLVPGFTYFDATNFSFLAVKPIFILATMFFLVESFFGWEAASFLAEETKNPEKTIPRALMSATITVVLLGVALAVMVFGAIETSAIAASDNPILLVAALVLPAVSPLIVLGVFFTFIGGVISNVISSPRLLFALARDKLFLEQGTKLHPKYGTPVNAILFQTAITVLVVIFAFGRYQLLLSMLVPLALVMYALVLLTIPVLRRTHPNQPRPFSVWGGKFLPVIVAMLYMAVVAAWFIETPGSLSVVTLILSFIILAFPIYLFLTMLYNPDAIISVSNSAAKLNYLLEDILFPRDVRTEILDLFRGHFRGKEVLEFGAGVGTFTMHLADEVGPTGSVVAVDLSRTNLDIIEGRAKKLGHLHVHVIHDEHQVNRVHPDIKRADIIYSIGFLGYVQDLKKVLREMHGVLAPNGKICFVEYTNFFRILPDPPLISNTIALEGVFREAGFAVNVRRRQGLFWNYLIINGIKTDTKVPYI